MVPLKFKFFSFFFLSLKVWHKSTYSMIISFLVGEGGEEAETVLVFIFLNHNVIYKSYNKYRETTSFKYIYRYIQNSL